MVKVHHVSVPKYSKLLVDKGIKLDMKINRGFCI